MSKDLLRMSYAVDSSFQPLVPSNVVLRPFQRAGVEYLLAVKRGLLADLMGMGKTPQAIATMNTAKVEQYLVIAPASLLGNWKREIEKWSTLDKLVNIFRPGKKNHREGILILSYGLCSNADMLRRILANYKFDGLIVDECQQLKSMDAGRTKNVLGIGGPFDRAEYVACLSGTPVVNRPVEIFAVASRLNPNSLGCKNFKDFGERYAEQKLNHSTNQIEFVGSKNELELGRRLRSTIMVRREKSAVLKDLPPKTRRAIYLNTNAAIDNLVSSENRLYDDFLANQKLDVDKVNSVMRVRVQLACLMAPQVIEYIKLVLETEHKVIVFCIHRQLMTELVAGLAGYNVRAISGATSPAARQQRVDDFQNDPNVRVFVGSIQAAGVGITLTAASYVVIPEGSWVPGENLQAEDRAHRITQHNHVMIDYLVFPRSVGERVLKVSGKKAAQISLCLDSGCPGDQISSQEF